MDEWWIHEYDQLEAAARESHRKAIRYHVVAHWVYGSLFAFDLVVLIWILIQGRVSWIMLASMTLIAVCWGFSLRRLRRIRDNTYEPLRFLRRKNE